MMKRLITLFFFLSFLTISAFSQTTVYETISFRNNTITIYRVDLTKDNLALFWKDESGNIMKSIGNLEDHLNRQGKELKMAMNGGMYLKDSSPQGWYVEKGKELASYNATKESYGNFYMQPNGVFMIEGERASIITYSDYIKKKYAPEYATQSGPMLVIDGELHQKFNEGSKSKYIRNGVGIIDSQHIVFAISNQPINFYDFALFFKDNLKATNALYLDGAISRMFIKDADRLDRGGRFGCMIGVYTDK